MPSSSSVASENEAIIGSHTSVDTSRAMELNLSRRTPWRVVRSLRSIVDCRTWDSTRFCRDASSVHAVREHERAPHAVNLRARRSLTAAFGTEEHPLNRDGANDDASRRLPNAVWPRLLRPC